MGNNLLSLDLVAFVYLTLRSLLKPNINSNNNETEIRYFAPPAFVM